MNRALETRLAFAVLLIAFCWLASLLLDFRPHDHSRELEQILASLPK